MARTNGRSASRARCPGFFRRKIRGAKGKKTPVLISKFILPDEYDNDSDSECRKYRMRVVEDVMDKTIGGTHCRRRSRSHSPVTCRWCRATSPDETRGATRLQSDRADRLFSSTEAHRAPYDRIFAAYGSGHGATNRRPGSLSQLMNMSCRSFLRRSGDDNVTTMSRGPLGAGNLLRLLFALDIDDPLFPEIARKCHANIFGSEGLEQEAYWDRTGGIGAFRVEPRCYRGTGRGDAREIAIGERRHQAIAVEDAGQIGVRGRF